MTKTDIQKAIVEQITYNLNKSLKCDFAFLIYDQIVYYAKYPLIPKVPYSPMTHLIQGIYNICPNNARSILRNKIYVNSAPTEMCLGMMRVAAKRYEVVNIKNNFIYNVPFIFKEIRYFYKKNSFNLNKNLVTCDKEAMLFASNLASNVVTRDELYNSNRRVASVLVSENNQVLAVGMNDNALNKTCHAEVNLIQSHFADFGRPLPKKSKLFTTLKPCKMCAAMISHSVDDLAQFKVYFLNDDIGKLAKNTILDQMSCRKKGTLDFFSVQEKLILQI